MATTDAFLPLCVQILEHFPLDPRWKKNLRNIVNDKRLSASSRVRKALIASVVQIIFAVQHHSVNDMFKVLLDKQKCPYYLLMHDIITRLLARERDDELAAILFCGHRRASYTTRDDLNRKWCSPELSTEVPGICTWLTLRPKPRTINKVRLFGLVIM